MQRVADHHHFYDFTVNFTAADGIKGHLNRLADLDLGNIHLEDFQINEQA